MQCLSCSNDIPPQFAHAVKVNTCPMCGDRIMPEPLQKILNGLHELLAEANQHSFEEPVLDWVCSNLNLIHRESIEFVSMASEVIKLNTELEEAKAKLANSVAKPVPKSGRPQPEIKMAVDEAGKPIQLSGEQIQDQETTNVFMQRAQVSKTLDKNAHLKQMVNQIKKNEASGGGSATASLMSASPEELEAMEQMIATDAAAAMPAIRSGLASSDYDGEEELDSVAQSFAAMGQGGQAGYNQRDVQKLQAVMQKSSSATRAMREGGSAGLIRRS
jgi:DNA-directed RNA polymerase subunit RPC12/RpoP